jgi:hypothetical protein
MQENYTEIFMQIYNGNNIEEAIEGLKKAGASQMDTFKVLKHDLHLSFKDADHLVLNAKYWEQNKEFTEKIRDALASYNEETDPDHPR